MRLKLRECSALYFLTSRVEDGDLQYIGVGYYKAASSRLKLVGIKSQDLAQMKEF